MISKHPEEKQITVATGKGRQKQLTKSQRAKPPSRVPYTNHDAAMAVPAGVCAHNPEKSNILCDCCPLPSITKWVQRYLSAEPTPEESSLTTTAPTYRPRARPISSKGKGLLDIYGELMARKKYGTAKLAETAAELNITLHDDDEIEMLLDEGERASMPMDLDYGAGLTRTWAMGTDGAADWEVEAALGEGTSTGRATVKDTTPPKVTKIFPEAHIKASSFEHGVVLKEAIRKAEQDVHWNQRGHPNMVIPAANTQSAGPSTGNRFNVLENLHD
jgi:hypothetical protein